MTEELEDLRRRVDQLERHLGILEYRLNYDEMHLEMATGWRQPARADRGGESAGDGGRSAEPAQDLRSGQVESLMRSVLLHQNDHTSDLRKAIGYLQILVERKVNDRRP